MGRQARFGLTLSALVAVLAVLGLVLPGSAPAAGFPEKGRAVTLIVSYPPGGGTDITGRLLGPMLEKELGTPVQVLNKPGAGGQVGFTEISRSRPDGYTIGDEMRLLAVMDKQRTKFYPDLKTAEEQGHKIYSGVHRGISMPAGAPKEVRDVLSEALKKVITSEEFRVRMEKLTYAPMYMDPQTYTTFWGDYENQGKKWVEWAKEK